MIEIKVWMLVTSADLEEMAAKARKIEQESRPGESMAIRDWDCGDNLTVRVVVDQDRATRKGLMIR